MVMILFNMRQKWHPLNVPRVSHCFCTTSQFHNGCYATNRETLARHPLAPHPLALCAGVPRKYFPVFHKKEMSYEKTI